MSGFPIGQRIVDPRVLSDELGGDSVPDMYSNLASYTFGSPRPPSLPSSYERLLDTAESISPLTTFVYRPASDRTPRPSVAPHSTNSPFHSVSSHPSQVVGLPASPSSQPRRTSARDSSPNTSGAVSGSDSERSHDPTPSPDPVIAAFFSSQRGGLVPDNASQHTFGRASRTHGVTAASSRDGATPSSSSASVTTSRSSSRASVRTTEQFSSDDELEFDYYDGNYSPVTFARDYLVDIDEDMDLALTGPSTFQSSRFGGRRGSLPMAIPGAFKPNDPHAARSREGSILTVRRPSRSWDESSAHRSSHSVEDPTIVLPKSEPLPRTGRLSLEVQHQGTSQQVEASVWDGLDLTYILPKHSEGSIRSFGSRVSFIQGGASGHRRSSPHLSGIPLTLGSTTTLQFEDSFTRHLQKHDRSFDANRYYWSFQREKADASNTSSRRRQQAHHHRNTKPAKESTSRVQEMWRCGHVGRFKVDRLTFKPQSADPAKAAQQRIQIRHIPDPYLMGSTITGPHSVIHKHSRAVAFSIFRSHGLFSGGRHAGATGMNSNPSTHMNMRSGTMLALKKVQEQYTSTKTTRQLGPFQSGDKKLGEKRDKGKGRTKAPSKGRGKDKSDKKRRPTESAESSTATSSAGSVKNSAARDVTSAPGRLSARVQFSPNASPPAITYHHESLNRPVSSMSLLSPSIVDSVSIQESESLLTPHIRHPRDHRDSVDSEDRPTRFGTTHAEAFSALDPNGIENMRTKTHNRTNADSSSTLERLFRVFRGGPKADEHAPLGTQPSDTSIPPQQWQHRAFQPPWMTTTGRDQQEENDRVLDDLNASFRDVGLLPNPHKVSKSGLKLRSRGGVLDQIPDDCLYMLLPLWPGETDSGSVHPETSSTASFATAIESRQFLLVYYVPFGEGSRKDKKPEKKRQKQSHSSDSGIEPDNKTAFLPAFRVVARVVTYDELRLSNIRIPSDGLAITGPEWEALNYPSPASDGEHMNDTVVCHCDGRERGFDFMSDGLMQLGLAIWEEPPSEVNLYDEAVPVPEGKMILTPIGRAAVEMIWLGCLAITSFGST